MTNEASPTLVDALAATRRTTPERIHALDQDDVALTREGVECLKKAAQVALTPRMDRESLKNVSLAEALVLFSQHMFWDEGDGRLLLCANLGGEAVCIPIEAGHWTVTIRGSVH